MFSRQRSTIPTSSNGTDFFSENSLSKEFSNYKNSILVSKMA